eukprot:6227574-Alexandrium_andersonii.AAC.1
MTRAACPWPRCPQREDRTHAGGPSEPYRGRLPASHVTGRESSDRAAWAPLRGAPRCHVSS